LEVASGVHLIPGIPLSRVYLIDGKSLILVDTGLPWMAGKVVQYIHSIGRRPDEVAMILITHRHPDHTGSAKAVARRTGAPVAAHVLDTSAASGTDGAAHLPYLPLPRWLVDMAPPLQGAAVDHQLEDRESLGDDEGLQVLHTPGHTPGSVCFLLRERGVLFAGDTVWGDGRNLSRSLPWPGSNPTDLVRSLKTLSDYEFDTLCGGHGMPVVGGASQQLRDLLEKHPEPPSWGGLLRRVLGAGS
jgi:glyoxylase-like metal-dependent hydrolase (beta-lactamase superfamily II)